MTRMLLSLAVTEIDRIAHRLEAYPGVCVYCGDDATTRDHLTPRLSSGEHPHTVPACHRCNSILGPFPSVSIPERAAFIATRETKKNRQLLVGLPHNLDDYGYALRTALECRASRRHILVLRLRNLRSGGMGNSHFEPLWG